MHKENHIEEDKKVEEERGTSGRNGSGDQEPAIGSNERIMIIALQILTPFQAKLLLRYTQQA